MHPVTRLSRVIQQLRSFGELHAGELETLAAELDSAESMDVAAKLRIYRDVQRDEAQMIVDELVDIQADMATAEQAAKAQAEALEPTIALTASGAHDPAINSPRRAKWLAEQSAEEERRRQPLSRRELFSRSPKPDA
jgi:hypothetical protein